MTVSQERPFGFLSRSAVLNQGPTGKDDESLWTGVRGQRLPEHEDLRKKKDYCGVRPWRFRVGGTWKDFFFGFYISLQKSLHTLHSDTRSLLLMAQKWFLHH